ncbi:MAG: hypothetical protein H6742_11070 [Alphaproteobacteria bacterium]|nr:hypothetical protein [Alphaproteobacteria bacterium]
MTTAPTVDELRTTDDIEGLLRRAATMPGPDSQRGDTYPWDWVSRAVPELPDDRATAVVQAAGRLLRTGDSDHARCGVSLLEDLRAHPAQPDAIGAALVDDSHLRAVGGDALLGDAWHAAAAALQFHPDGDLRDRLRQAALQPGRALHVLAALSRRDTDWVVDHAVDIATASPDALPVLMFTLSRWVDDLAPIVRRLDGPVPRGELRKAIRSEVRKSASLSADARRKALLDLLA